MIRIASPWASCQALGFVEAGLPGSGGYRVGVVVVLGAGGWWWSPGGLVLDGGVHVDGGVGAGGVVPVHPLGGGDGDVG